MVMEALKTSNVVINTGAKTSFGTSQKSSFPGHCHYLTWLNNSLEKAPLARCCFCLTWFRVSMGKDLDPRVLLKTVRCSTTTVEGYDARWDKQEPCQKFERKIWAKGHNFLKNLSRLPGMRMFYMSRPVSSVRKTAERSSLLTLADCKSLYKLELKGKTDV